MYIPEFFKVADLRTLHAFMRKRPFATLVSSGSSGLIATHLPTVLKGANEDTGVIECHLARANPHWKDLAAAGSSNGEALMIFQGAEGYVSPSWYPGKVEHGKVVPTWNYATVHAYGCPEVVDDRDWLLRHVTELSDQQERVRPKPWAVSDAPNSYIDMMLRGIVGFRFIIHRIEGKWKMSQNREDRDRIGVIEGLRQRNTPNDAEMLAYLEPDADAAR